MRVSRENVMYRHDNNIIGLISWFFFFSAEFDTVLHKKELRNWHFSSLFFLSFFPFFFLMFIRQTNLLISSNVKVLKRAYICIYLQR